MKVRTINVRSKNMKSEQEEKRNGERICGNERRTGRNEERRTEAKSERRKRRANDGNEDRTTEARSERRKRGAKQRVL